jgi:hypothetical protein
MTRTIHADTTRVASFLAALERPSTYDPGFVAIDRRLYRIARDHLGGELADALMALTLERDRLAGVTLADLTEILGRSPKVTRRILTALEAAGAIAWHRAANQYTGAVVLVADLERPHRGRRPASPKVTAAATPVDNAVEAETTPPVVVPVVVPIRHDQTNAYIHREQEQEPPLSPVVPEPAPVPTSAAGESTPTLEELPTAVADVIRHATTIVTDRRAVTRGPAGPGARRKVADTIARDHADTIARYLAEGARPHRVAEAVAARLEGEANASPFTAGEIAERRQQAAEACTECDGGFVWWIETHHGRELSFAKPCACQTTGAAR